MLKNMYFLRNTKIAAASGGQTSALLLSPAVSILSGPFLALNAFCYYRKSTKQLQYTFPFASSALLHLFSTLDSVVFVGGGARVFLALGRKVPLLRHWERV